MRFFLRAHRARLALGSIEQPRFLSDFSAVFQDINLAARLDLNRLADEADGIHVLDFAARAKLVAGLAHGNVDVGAQIALFHVAVAGAKVTQYGAQFRYVSLRFLGRAHVGL